MSFFISYHCSIQDYVQRLKDFLIGNGYNAKDIVDSNNSQITKSISAASIVICCITKAYAQSENCQREIMFAHKIRKPLIILMFEKVDNIYELGSIGLFIAALLRINIFEDPQVVINWTGPKANEILRSLPRALD